jgi:hypothetical protein
MRLDRLEIRNGVVTPWLPKGMARVISPDRHPQN